MSITPINATIMIVKNTTSAIVFMICIIGSFGWIVSILNFTEK